MPLNFKSRSVLLYGDNGSGKSTVADVVEWFYNDKVEHLTGEETGRSGVEALRHIDLSLDDVASADIKLSSNDLNAVKTLTLKGDKFKSAYSNDSDKFKDYILQSQKENLILRYRDLTKFILATKTERLEALSAIIGFKEITTTRDVLKSAHNGILRDIKARNFPRSISEHQQEIIAEYGQNVTSDDQFLAVTRDIISKLELDIELHSLGDVDVALKKIGKPDNASAIKKEAFLSRLVDQLVPAATSVADIEEQFGDFHKIFTAIISDITVFRKLLLGNLLTSARNLLGDDAYNVDECPVCLTPKDRNQLKQSVDKRIDELAEIRAEQKKLTESTDDVRRRVTELVNNLESVLSDEQASEDWFAASKTQIIEFINALKRYESAVDVRPVISAEISTPEDLKISVTAIEEIHQRVKEQRDQTREVLKSDPSWEIYNKVNNAGRAYAAIRRLNAEKAKLDAQSGTLAVFYTEFLERQRESIEMFLDTFSDRIQEIYQFMNPGEKVGNIKLVPIEKNDEMVGVTFQLDFLNHEGVSPPHKFLSESHLNCFGIAFFLASAGAFNKENKFLILDDVISSFDESHRKRFADLLAQQYDQYQLIVLTHERGWFELFRNLVKGKNWFIDAFKYTEDNGTEIGISPRGIKEAIEAKISEQDVESLAGLARKYLEHLLKDIASNLEVRVPFRFNDSNEDRMCAELLSDLRSHLNRRGCKELNDSNVLNRLEGSTFIGNKDSHDSSFSPSFSDAKAFWDDICEFQSQFLCGKCGTFLSTRYVDSVTGKIRCKSGELIYSWKK